MKRSRFFITGALLLVVAVAAVAIVSCRKEAEGPLVDKGQIVRNDLDAKAAIARITGFKRQVDLRKSEPGLRSMETSDVEAGKDPARKGDTNRPRPPNPGDRSCRRGQSLRERRASSRYFDRRDAKRGNGILRLPP